jgi:hypothetical protein
MAALSGSAYPLVVTHIAPSDVSSDPLKKLKKKKEDNCIFLLLQVLGDWLEDS